MGGEGYEIPRQSPPYQGPLFRGRGAGERGPIPGQGLSKQETQKQKAPTKSGITGLAYLCSIGGMASGDGGGTPPPDNGGPLDDKGDDETRGGK